MKILLLAGCWSGQGHGLYWLEVVDPVECSGLWWPFRSLVPSFLPLPGSASCPCPWEGLSGGSRQLPSRVTPFIGETGGGGQVIWEPVDGTTPHPLNCKEDSVFRVGEQLGGGPVATVGQSGALTKAYPIPASPWGVFQVCSE